MDKHVGELSLEKVLTIQIGTQKPEGQRPHPALKLYGVKNYLCLRRYAVKSQADRKRPEGLYRTERFFTQCGSLGCTLTSQHCMLDSSTVQDTEEVICTACLAFNITMGENDTLARGIMDLRPPSRVP